jgi:hypothetical protein
MTVQIDDGRSVQVDLKDYNRIDHGYAATIHKAQGMTVDRTHVLATPGMDAHSSYVALSRHRRRMDLHYGRDDFANEDRLVRTLSRNDAPRPDGGRGPERETPERVFLGSRSGRSTRASLTPCWSVFAAWSDNSIGRTTLTRCVVVKRGESSKAWLEVA